MMYLVAAFTHDGHPFGSSKVATREDAERAAQRYMENTRVGRVSVKQVDQYPAIARGNGRYR
jgi:hypothetical protein